VNCKLQEEALLAVFHPMALEKPLVVPLRGVEGVCQQPAHLECEAWTQFLQPGLFPIFSEDISVTTHEHEVTLVVEGDHVPANKFRLVGEQRSEEPPHPVA